MRTLMPRMAAAALLLAVAACSLNGNGPIASDGSALDSRLGSDLRAAQLRCAERFNFVLLDETTTIEEPVSQGMAQRLFSGYDSLLREIRNYFDSGDAAALQDYLDIACMS